MGGLPSVSGREAVRALTKAGFREARQSGSHIVMQKAAAGTTITVVVPAHPELARGTLRAIIRKAGLTVEQFVALL